ncbi:hypothetical protein MRS44_002614 [Fusarium solani]|uniref:Fucose-specific lectin n=1 Tax=Fusarium solani TaxID=169388 RepID=A0A9P9RAR1_FUSSL|nr:uncharacterized protein B0J15DRAFT_480969 [Fusarium solani]KAH7272107.1 hypothetical protein B0J15DRAFT_480969 [Fusarium solani]KAJ3468549.1 hypothetical protein MRS44_002614 [Fusarium solani]
MRDDERYPTVVDPPPDHSLPEVVTGTQVDPHGRDKVVSDIQDPGMIPTYDDAQKEVAGGEKGTKDMAGAAGVGTRGGEAADSIDKGPRRIFGMKRRKFLIVLAAIMFMLVAATVGGTVGGIHANKGDDNGKEDGGGGGGDGGGDGGDDNDDSTPTTTDTGPVPRKTGPIDADERFLAAVVAADDDDENFQVFYNDLNTTNILYRRMHDDDGGAEHTLDLDIEPNYGTPLAATLRLASSIMTTQLFYVTTEDNETQIAQVTLNCGNLNADDDDGDDDNDDDGDDDDDNQAGGTANSGTAACAVTSNSIISTNLTNGVHPDSKLAALRLSNDSTRVYFQASGTNIWVLNGDDADAEGWVGSNLMGGVRPGSSIAATRSNATDTHVFFVANSTGWMRTLNYADVLGSDDSQVVDDQPGSSWRASAFFDATYIPSLNSYRVFYTNPSSGSIVSYFRNGAQADWTSNNDNAWGRPASGITAVGWQDNVRLFYYQSGRLTMSANDGDDWEDAEPVA